MSQYFRVILLVIFIHCNIKGIGQHDSIQEKYEFSLAKDVVWANLQEGQLTMDIYTPKNDTKKHPVLVIIHGGAWLINTSEIMDSTALYLMHHAEYVVCNINYRTLPFQENTLTLNTIIEDAMGAVLWIQNHISQYGGDSTKICITGDSAGGHLAAMIVLAGKNLTSEPFTKQPHGFKPTWLPAGKTAEDIVKEGGIKVQAAILNYPAVDLYAHCLTGFETSANFFWNMAKTEPRNIFGDSLNVLQNAELYKAVSPLYLIKSSDEETYPPIYILVGDLDIITPTFTVRNFAKKLSENGHFVVYEEYKGQPHAYLDAVPHAVLGTKFYEDAPWAIDKMIAYLKTIFPE